VAVACADPSGERFLTPLPAYIDTRLVTHRWEVVEVVHQGEEVRFDGVPHFRLGFRWEGSLGYASGCYSWSFQIDFESQTRYRLTRRENLPGVTCVDPRDKVQYAALVRALEATQEYHFQDNQLWLTGEETRFVLEVAESYPSFPAAERSLILNRWRLMEVWDQTGNVDSDELLLFNIRFFAPNLLSVDREQCKAAYYQSTMPESGGYVLTRAELPRCEGATDQTERVLNALSTTTHYELQGEQLILTGNNARIVLQIGGRLSGYTRTFPRPTNTPPVSPLIPGSNRTLAENRWRLVEIQFHGESVEFGSLAPVYFTFGGNGSLGFKTTGCNATGFTIEAENERRYRLTPGAMTAMSCSEIQERQHSGIGQAVMATTEYEMQESQLFLFGDDVRITLEIDNPE